MSLARAVESAVGVAVSALSDLKVSGRLYRTREGEFDPTLGRPTRILELDFEVEAVVLDYDAKEVDGERVRATDRRLYIFARPGLPEPEPGDAVRVGKLELRLEEVKTLRAGVRALLYETRARL